MTAQRGVPLLIYFYLAALGLCCCAHGLSLVVASRGYSFVVCGL